MPKKTARGWRNAQSKTKTKQRTKLALAVIALIVGLIIISVIVRFTQTLFNPWTQNSAISKNYQWQGKSNINVLVRTPAISILSYNSKEERVIVIDIPDELFLPVSRDYGFWQLRAVYGLGQYDLLKDTLTAFLAIPIDGFLDLSTLGVQKPASSIVENIRKNPFLAFKFASYLKSDLTPWELIKLERGISSVRFDKIEYIDLVKSLDKDRLPDGTEIYTGDPVKLDSILSKLADPTLVLEHKSIAIFNATNQPQLAQKWARLVTNLGGGVIITDNAKKRLAKTQIVGEQSQTLIRLQQIFTPSKENLTVLDCQNNPKCDKISSSDEDLVSSRAQINLFLGEDYVKR